MCICICICYLYCNMYMYIVAHLASQPVIELGSALPYAHAAAHLLMYMYVYIYRERGREGKNGGSKWWEIVVGNEKSGRKRWGDSRPLGKSTSPCLVAVIPASTGMPYPGPMPPMMLQPTGAVMVC